MEADVRKMLGRMVTLQRYYDQSVVPQVTPYEDEAPAVPEPARRASKRAAQTEVIETPLQVPEEPT